MPDNEIPASAAVLVHNMIMSVCDLENRRKIQKPLNVPFNFGKRGGLGSSSRLMGLSRSIDH